MCRCIKIRMASIHADKGDYKNLEHVFAETKQLLNNYTTERLICEKSVFPILKKQVETGQWNTPRSATKLDETFLVSYKLTLSVFI